MLGNPPTIILIELGVGRARGKGGGRVQGLALIPPVHPVLFVTTSAHQPLRTKLSTIAC